MAKFTKKVEGYEILDIVGNPQGSRVSVGREVETDRTVAIKALPLDLFTSEREFEQFVETTDKVSQLRHPNVLVPEKVIGKFTEAYLIGELIDGPNIRTFVADKTPDVPAVTKIAVQLLNALQFLHSKQLLHRNLKGTNVLVRPDGTVAMCDMHYSRVFLRWRREKGYPSVESVRYVSPEECLDKKLTPESDVYSLGIILYYAYTRTMPIRGHSAVELQMLHVKQRLRERPETINPAIPSYISKMLLKMLEKAPRRRYTQLGELILDMRRLAGDKPGSRTGRRI